MNLNSVLFKKIVSVGLWSIVLATAATMRGAENVIISEFLASNAGGLLDEDGDSSDWIEIYNSGGSAVNLFGWYLTDDNANLNKWTFPATNIAPRGFLIVFASGKDRTAPGAPLHTSFGLNSSGGYLALVHPDGVTIAREYAPYPEQHANYSYGLGQTILVTKFLNSNAPAKVFVPANGSLGLSWVSNSFSDAGWISGTNGVGYETSVPGFSIRNIKANITVDTLAKTEGVITNAAQQSGIVATNDTVINYTDSQGDGHYGSNRAFPGYGIAQNVDDYVLEILGTVTIPAAGNWTFGVNSDDGFRLKVGSFTVEYDPPRGPGDTLATFNFAAAGDYPLRLIYYERGGGAEVELFAAQGTFAAWGANFSLVGDVASGGLAVRSTPVSGGTGIGYRSLIRTDVQSQMLSNNATAYVRLPFSLTNAASFTALNLSMKYDDGFVAYLNGVEVARRNAPVSPQWNSAATASHLGVTAEDINLSDRLDLLLEGSNLLAIQGLNLAASDVDFFIAAELSETKGIATSNQYFAGPSPGALNGSGGFAGFVGDTKFSQDRGFYSNSFSCIITTATAGATIRYTLNGSEPTLANGSTYTGPLTISNTTILRAAAFLSGLVPSDVDTETYIFVNDVVLQSPAGQAPGPGWPTGTSSAGQIYDYGMDPDIVNVAPWSTTIRDDLKSLPTFSIVTTLSNLFDNANGIYANPRGDEIAWERPASLELIYPDGTQGFQINCGLRVRGGFSRDPSNPKHAFRFFFRQEYGASKLHFPIFGDKGADTFDKIDLRTMQNYSWAYQNDARMTCLRDQFSRDAQIAMGQISSHGIFCHLYVDGQYWGLYNTDERPEAAFGETYVGGRAEDYDTIKVDPDLGYNIEATDGNTTAWLHLWQAATNGFASDADYFKVQGLNVDGTVNTNYENLVDVDNLIDYMLVIIYGGNLDAPISNFLGNDSPNNMFAIRDRTGKNGGFRFIAHDSEHTLLNVNEDRTGIVDGTIGGINADWTAGNPVTQAPATAFTKSSGQYFWFRLQLNAEFRLRVADHMQRACFNGGILSTEGARAQLTMRSNEIYRAMVCESARWGDAKRVTPFTRNDWISAMNTVNTTFVGGRTTVFINQMKADNLFPTISAPNLNNYGGFVPPGFNLYMTNLNSGSVIYYTLNGPDPRVRGGGISPVAQAYSPGTPIPINFQTVLRARVLSGSTWSAMITATYFATQDFSKLKITEIMYNPPAVGLTPGDEFEFVELKNTGANTFDLSGLSFTSGINFSFTNGTRLGSGQFLVLGRNAAQLASKYPGLVVNGIYTGKLDNGGETITLSHILGGTVLSFAYDDVAPWAVAPDGFGFSLVPVNPNVNPDPNNPANWRASSLSGGSPGADDPAVAIAPILINEILTHSDPPPPSDSIELFNPTGVPVDIGGWFLTDDPGTPMKFRIPDGTMILDHGFRVFDESDFNPTPGTNNSFALSSQGEQVYLFSGDATTNLTGYSHGFSFGAAANGVTFGRYINSVGEEQFPAQISSTLLASNSGPRVGPVVLTEIMYNPLVNYDEYVEIMNITASSVPLYDPAHATNTWRLNGVGFDFPPNVMLAPGERLLIVPMNPAAYRAKYSLSASLQIVGPYAGALQNDGERLELQRPDSPDTNGVPYITVDGVRYGDRFPWPSAADGSGPALRRLSAAAYGDDPVNWVATAGVPPLILSQPLSQTFRQSSNVTFAVTASGSPPLRYQWYFEGSALANRTNASLLITNIQPANAGNYFVVVSNFASAVTSAVATLTVGIPPVMVRQPVTTNALVGTDVTFTAAASGTLPLSFRWRWRPATNGASTINLTNFIVNQTNSAWF
ncbi:MAG TPA: lamin tail domain-containing protein, partial [Verrucomicrobiae bacterium]